MFTAKRTRRFSLRAYAISIKDTVMFDYHVHSNISGDSEAHMSDICMGALRAGLTEICFTEHFDLDYPYSDINFVADLDAYDVRFAQIKRQFPQLIIKQGVEVGLKAESMQRINDALEDRSYDFIIASQHLINNADPFYGGFFENRTKKEALEAYLIETAACLRLFDHFSVVGHLGYPCKYCPQEDKRMLYADHANLIDGLLKDTIARGKGIEVNSVTYDIMGSDMPEKGVLKRYRELKGEIITFGSDAHTGERVGQGYGRVTAYLKEIGFDYICAFEQMKPVFHKI